MKKVMDYIKKYKLYFLTFLLSAACVVIIYTLKGVSPFGDKSLLCVDFYHQYGPMLAELRERILTGKNLIYSFSMGMGLPFFRNFLNYLSSPFNILILLTSKKGLVTMYSVIIGLKVIVSSVSFVYYLSKKFDKKDLYLIVFGIMYAFSAYFTAYYWNIMWIDGLVFLPLVALGIEELVNKKKWKLYTFSLAIMLMANYFIGYMICAFSVIYFLLYNFSKTEFNRKNFKEKLFEYFKRCLRFGVASLASGCLVAFLLLPMFKSMSSISATGDTMPTTQYYDFTLKEFVVSNLSNTYSTVFASDAATPPNVSCGILAFVLVLIYILNLKIPIKNKICYMTLLGFFLLCFLLPSLDYIMQAFHVPNDLPYRYSFLYSFTLTLISVYSLINIKKCKFGIVTNIYIIFMFMLIFLQDSIPLNISKESLQFNMILLTIYYALYAIYYNKDKIKLIKCNILSCILIIILLGIQCIDSVISVKDNWNPDITIESFYEGDKDKNDLLKFVREIDNEKFYRMENDSTMTLNESSWLGYNGMTTFSSMAYQNMAYLQAKLGLPGNQINSYYYVQTTPIYDLMFDMKYFVGQSNDLTRYSEIGTFGNYILNRFDYNVGLIYGVDQNLLNWNHGSENPFDIQNDFIEKATGIENVLERSVILSSEEIYSENNNLVMKFSIENKFDNLYLYSEDFSIDFFIIGDCLYYNNEDYLNYISNIEEIDYTIESAYGNDGEFNIINIDSSEEVLDIYVGYNDYYSQTLDVFTINQNRFEEAYEYLNKYKANLIGFKENKIEADITLDKDMLVYTSIPYDDGWSVYIDGKKVETKALANTLLTFKCNEGKHNIVLKYRIPYFLIGLLISLLALVGIIFFSQYENGGLKIRKIQ